MSYFKDMFRKQTAFEVVGGKNLFNKSSANMYRMVSLEKEHGEGTVQIKGRIYYFLGSHKEEKHKRSAGKAAAGAVVGGVLTGGLGAVVGAAAGGHKKDDSIFFMDFMDYETEQAFTVQVKQLKGHFHAVNDFRVANIQIEEDETNLNPADELMKYKQLLDMEAITQDEFDKKKQELL